MRLARFLSNLQKTEVIRANPQFELNGQRKLLHDAERGGEVTFLPSGHELSDRRYASAAYCIWNLVGAHAGVGVGVEVRE